MPATVSITETQVLTVLRSFILSLVSLDGDHVIRGLQNRVAMPAGDFIEITASLSSPLSTNVQTYAPDNSGSLNKRSTQLSVQIDCYGVSAMDNANMLSMMLRSDYACQKFAESGLDMQPLYANDAHQMPFVTGEEQYMERWVFDAVLQFNPVVTVPQDFADSLEVGLIDVDVVYPP
jgi:hypothetical protein